MLKSVYTCINSLTAPLYTVIAKTDYFFIDYWSFVHFINGLLIVFFLRRAQSRYTFPILFGILLGWEIIEISFIYLSIAVFDPETLPDQITDILIGLLGGLVMWYVPRLRAKYSSTALSLRLPPLTTMELGTACTMSCLWVGFYGYRYNIDIFNSPVINWLAFTLWSIGLIMTIRVYKLLENILTLPWQRLIATWTLYFAGLLVVEYCGYYVFEIRQVTNERPLMFGLIHGTATLKFYYLVAGICAIGLNGFLENILRPFRRNEGPGGCNSQQYDQR
jgi:hypothetical protein